MNEILLLSALVLLPILAAGVCRVPDHRVLAVRRLGRYRRTLGPGWHWIVPGLDRAGAGVDLIGHHLHVRGPDSAQAELHFQIVEPEKAGDALEGVDALVAAQAREALGGGDRSPEWLKTELNRRVGRFGLRVIRCSMHVG
jgi:regulator of protease activity HflC (stomatin/prohibitin superfamily)